MNTETSICNYLEVQREKFMKTILVIVITQTDRNCYVDFFTTMFPLNKAQETLKVEGWI